MGMKQHRIYVPRSWAEHQDWVEQRRRNREILKWVPCVDYHIKIGHAKAKIKCTTFGKTYGLGRARTRRLSVTEDWDPREVLSLLSS